MTPGLTNHRDVRAAMLNAIKYGNNKNGKVRFDSFQIVFPARFHPACNPDEFKAGGVRPQMEKHPLATTSLIFRMGRVSHFTKAMYGAGHEWVGIKLIFQMEAADAKQNGEAKQLIHAAT
ncbi:hypothetical protein PGQ11_009834 [Apiospora arundinis]|uniref:Uncharacterized protein n=1 Tax=Apiospora arundinis TaxID=335852 RepID=A0ABR2I8U7_9PEZI